MPIASTVVTPKLIWEGASEWDAAQSDYAVVHTVSPTISKIGLTP